MAKRKPRINHVLIALAKQLIDNKASSVVTYRPLRESMIDLHQSWYTMEKQWKKFLDAVKKKQPYDICTDLISASATMLMVATELYDGPTMYEAPLPEDTFDELLRNKSCPKCSGPGDVISVIPQIDRPIWKLQCSECEFCWFSNNSYKNKPLFPIGSPTRSPRRPADAIGSLTEDPDSDLFDD